MTLATRIAVMHQDILQQYDTPKTIYETPANMFVAGFMGSPNMNFFRGRFADASGNPGVVLDGGGDAPLPLTSPRHSGLTAGQEVIFGVRPEHFSPAHEQRAERKGGQSVVIPIAVDMDEPTGSETILMATVAGQDAIIVCDPDEAPKPGSTMDFAIDMTKANLFDPKTGLRL